MNLLPELIHKAKFLKKENPYLLKIIHNNLQLSKIIIDEETGKISEQPGFDNLSDTNIEKFNKLLITESAKTGLIAPIKINPQHNPNLLAQLKYIPLSLATKEGLNEVQKKKNPIFNLTYKNDDRPAMTGVHYANGFIEATNATIAAKIKYPYPPKYENKIIKESGIPINTKFPNIDYVIPKSFKEDYPKIEVNLMDLYPFTNAVNHLAKNFLPSAIPLLFLDEFMPVLGTLDDPDANPFPALNTYQLSKLLNTIIYYAGMNNAKTHNYASLHIYADRPNLATILTSTALPDSIFLIMPAFVPTLPTDNPTILPFNLSNIPISKYAADA